MRREGIPFRRVVGQCMSWQSGLQIRVVEGPDLDTITPLNFTRMTIGRARSEGSKAEGWLLLYDKSVSRQHAELVWDEDRKTFSLRHLSKTNLTWVNDESVESEVILQPGHLIKIGSSKFLMEESTADLGAAGDESPLAQPGELTERLQVGAATAAALSLRSTDSPKLTVVDGPEKGRVADLTGFYLTIGRGSVQADQINGQKDALKFDQLVELKDSTILPNHLILKWDELRDGFAIWKSPTAPDCPVLREADGFVWQTSLTDAGGVVRVGDRVLIGNTTVALGTPEEESKPEAPVRPLPLRVEK